MAITPHPLFITLPFVHERPAPSFDSDADKFPDTLARHFIQYYTAENDKIFDPFAGLGTSLFTAKTMGRQAYGIEADRARYEWVAAQLENWMGLRHDDAYHMDGHGFPKFDFVMTSPPFMASNHKWNPLYGGDPDYAGYDIYLERIGAIFAKLPYLMKKQAYLLVHADNLLRGFHYTPLATDIAHVISDSFVLKSEIIVAWDKPPAPDYRHAHCLLFKKK